MWYDFFFLQNISIFPFLEKGASFDFLMIFRDFQNIADFTGLNSLVIQATMYRSRSHFDKGWRRESFK